VQIFYLFLKIISFFPPRK